MKYELSFCEIEQLSKNIFETTTKQGIVLDKNCADEAWNFWNNLRDKPFGLLVNYSNSFEVSFEGSRNIDRHHLQLKTAILLNNTELNTEMNEAIELKKMLNDFTNHKVFSDREEALNWLSDI